MNFQSKTANDAIEIFSDESGAADMSRVLDELIMQDMVFMSDEMVTLVVSDIMVIAYNCPGLRNRALCGASAMLDYWREEYEDGEAREANEAGE